jgi:hypothetical protein
LRPGFFEQTRTPKLSSRAGSAVWANLDLEDVHVSAMAHVNVATVEACLNKALDSIIHPFAGRKLAYGGGGVRHNASGV